MKTDPDSLAQAKQLLSQRQELTYEITQLSHFHVFKRIRAFISGDSLDREERDFLIQYRKNKIAQIDSELAKL